MEAGDRVVVTLGRYSGWSGTVVKVEDGSCVVKLDALADPKGLLLSKAEVRVTLAASEWRIEGLEPPAV